MAGNVSQSVNNSDVGESFKGAASLAASAPLPLPRQNATVHKHSIGAPLSQPSMNL